MAGLCLRHGVIGRVVFLGLLCVGAASAYRAAHPERLSMQPISLPMDRPTKGLGVGKEPERYSGYYDLNRCGDRRRS